MPDWRAFLMVVHLLSTLLMAAPFDMLIVVNERARFGAPLGYFTDRYLENIIRANAVRCFVFQGTMLASGAGLVYVSGYGWGALFTNPSLIIKWVAFFLMVGFLAYIHLSVQPRIESLMEQVKPNSPVPADVPPKIMRLRSRRKKLSASCLFLVLTALIMGLRVTFSYSAYLAIIMVVVAAAYAYRVYRKPVRLGWI